MKLRFINHSSVQIEQRGESLLMDPWVTGRIFNGAWALVRETGFEFIDFESLRYIWVSHEHPDHFNFPSLKKVAAACKHPVQFLYRKQESTGVREAVIKMGFSFMELENDHEYELANGMKIRCFSTATDAALFVQGDDQNLLNLNDCILSDTQLQRMRGYWSQLDVLLMQFSQAGFQGNPEDESFRLRHSRRYLFDFIQSRVNLLRPRVLMPIASHSYFCVETNFYLNGYRVFPDELIARIQSVPVAILLPGEELSPDPLLGSERAALTWRQWISQTAVQAPEPLPSEEQILAAANAYLEFLRTRIPRFFWPAALRIFLMNQKRYLRMDVHSNRAEYVAVTPADVQLPEHDFIYFARFPWGADTVAVAGSLRILSHWRWKSHYYLRHAAYVFSHRRGAFIAALAWALTFLRTSQWRFHNFLFKWGLKSSEVHSSRQE